MLLIAYDPTSAERIRRREQIRQITEAIIKMPRAQSFLRNTNVVDPIPPLYLDRGEELELDAEHRKWFDGLRSKFFESMRSKPMKIIPTKPLERRSDGSWLLSARLERDEPARGLLSMEVLKARPIHTGKSWFGMDFSKPMRFQSELSDTDRERIYDRAVAALFRPETSQQDGLSCKPTKKENDADS